MRTFIHYGPNGEIIAVARVEVMPEELPNPFNVTDESHEVIELESSDPMAARAGREIHDNFVMDVKSKRLRRGATKAAAQLSQPAAAEQQPPPAEPEQPPPTSETPKRQPRQSKPGDGQS